MKKVACIQMDIEFGNPSKNFQVAQKWIDKAANEQCDTVVLPELWTTGYDLSNLDRIGDENAQQTIQFLQKNALKYNINLVGGSTAKKVAGNHYNTLLVVNRNGELVKEYSKLHLFKLMDEHKFLKPGKEDGLFSLDNERFAGVICYDIRFPEWIRQHALEKIKAIFVCAEWPAPRLHHWKTLLMARAIENQCYVIACNRSGNDPNNHFAGHSLIIDPWGEVVSEGSAKEQLVIGDIDLTLVDDVRNRIPVFSDRLPNFYTNN